MPEWRGELGTAQVIVPATHDTGSAIAAVPVAQDDEMGVYQFGTWSLVGTELPQPLMSAETLTGNWTNEGGVFGTTRFLKNVMGLWLLQECQRAWTREQQAQDYDTLLAEIDHVPAFAALIDPDDPRFLAPEHMPDAINDYLAEHGQRTLHTPSAFARCIMESLVLRYCEVLRQLERLTGGTIKGVHVLGGGSRNVKPESVAGRRVWRPCDRWANGGDRARQRVDATGRSGRTAHAGRDACGCTACANTSVRATSQPTGPVE